MLCDTHRARLQWPNEVYTSLALTHPRGSDRISSTLSVHLSPTAHRRRHGSVGRFLFYENVTPCSMPLPAQPGEKGSPKSLPSLMAQSRFKVFTTVSTYSGVIGNEPIQNCSIARLFVRRCMHVAPSHAGRATGTF